MVLSTLSQAPQRICLALIPVASTLVYQQYSKKQEQKQEKKGLWLKDARGKLEVLAFLFAALRRVSVASSDLSLIDTDSGKDVMGMALWDRYMELDKELDVIRVSQSGRFSWGFKRQSEEKKKEEWTTRVEELQEELEELEYERIRYLVAFKLCQDGLILTNYICDDRDSKFKGILLQNFMPELLRIAKNLVSMLFARESCELPPFFESIADLGIGIINEHERYWIQGRVDDLQFAVRAIEAASQIPGCDGCDDEDDSIFLSTYPELQRDFKKALEVHKEVMLPEPPLPAPAVKLIRRDVRFADLDEYCKQVVQHPRPPLKRYPDLELPFPFDNLDGGSFAKVYFPEVPIDPIEDGDCQHDEVKEKMNIVAKIPVNPYSINKSLNQREFDALDDEIGVRFLRELRIWANLSHPNILPLTGYTMCSFKHQKEKPRPTMVSRRMTSTLKKFLTDEERNLEALPGRGAVMRLNLLLEIASALEYMHHRPEGRVVHGDLCDDNILMTPYKSAMLCDFGLSKMIDVRTGQTTDNVSGRESYSAPEMLWGDYYVMPRSSCGKELRRQRSRSTKPESGNVIGMEDDVPHRNQVARLVQPCISPPCDVYAFGIVAIKVLTGIEPWDYHLPRPKPYAYPKAFYFQPYSPRLWLVRDTSLRAVLARCMHPQPEKRLSMRTVKRFLEGWLKKVKEAEEIEVKGGPHMKPLADSWDSEKDVYHSWEWS